MKIEDVKRKYEEVLLQKANVVGVMTAYKIKEGKRTKELSILCMVERKLPKEALRKRDIIPSKIEDAPTDVVQVGRIRALKLQKRERIRPCPMGTSGGHYMITAGTNGELLKDKKTAKLCIGTNNHVGANSNAARIGDPYLQPAPYDGGREPEDVIGHLLRFVPIEFVGDPSLCAAAKLWSSIYNLGATLLKSKSRVKAVIAYPKFNLVDAAMIEVEKESVLSHIMDIGVPKGVREAALDMLVQKSGRTTCHTSQGLITAIDATIGPVIYGPEKVAFFKDQIIIEKERFSAGGDSGSLILDMEGYAVGKLFAGSEEGGYTIANPIHPYLELLDAELLTE